MHEVEAAPVAAIEGWRRGEEQAVRAVFGAYYPRAVRLGVLSGLGMDEAQDCAQEAFVHAFERRLQLRDPQAFPLWFHRIATRHILELLEKRKRGKEVGLDSAASLIEDWQRRQMPQPDEEAIAAEQRDALWSKVQALPPRYRVPLVLRYYGNFSPHEVAHVMGTRPGTMRVTLHRALHQLRLHAHDGVILEQFAALG
jgi:RNA polymerase sigma-70 factor (ECF subfamily)